VTEHQPPPSALVIKTVVVVVLACVSAALAALEIYAIVDGFGSQPHNCYVEDSTKVAVLGLLGSIVVVIALAPAALGAWSIVKRRPGVGKVLGAFVAALCAFVVWVFLAILAFGC